MPSTSTVIGELSIEESEALKALLSLGTCVISEMGGPVLNPATPTIPTTEPLHVGSGSLDNSENTDTSKNLMSELSVSVPDAQSIPMEERLQTQNVSVIKDPMPRPSTDETYTSTSSEGTKKYKALSGEQFLGILNNQLKIALKHCSIPKKDKCSVKSETSIFPTHKTAAQYKLRIQTHHLKRKRKHKYYFKCAVPGCPHSFNSVKEWNIHHLAKHKTVTYRCGECTKHLQTPTSMRSHELTHGDKPFSCGRCGKTFLHLSKLNLHRHLHRRQRLYSCFALHCKRTYKWPQDLLCHIKKHLNITLKCQLCMYTTYEKRLLRQHSNLHTNELPFGCRKCHNECFKHAMQCYRHEQKCYVKS